MNLFSMVVVDAGFQRFDGVPQCTDFALLSLDSRLLRFELSALPFDLGLLFLHGFDEYRQQARVIQPFRLFWIFVSRDQLRQHRLDVLRHQP
jgi:hypothetical protein